MSDAQILLSVLVSALLSGALAALVKNAFDI